jgi:hypothetical protein
MKRERGRQRDNNETVLVYRRTQTAGGAYSVPEKKILVRPWHFLDAMRYNKG